MIVLILDMTYSKSFDRDRPLLLIVDGDDAVRSDIAQNLEKLRWEVVQAGNINDAIELCETRCLNVILADFSMFETETGNSIQAFRYCNSGHQSTTIIAYGDQSQPTYANKCRDQDVDLFVSKPLNYKHLLVYIARASTRRFDKIHQLRLGQAIAFD